MRTQSGFRAPFCLLALLLSATALEAANGPTGYTEGALRPEFHATGASTHTDDSKSPEAATTQGGGAISAAAAAPTMDGYAFYSDASTGALLPSWNFFDFDNSDTLVADQDACVAAGFEYCSIDPDQVIRPFGNSPPKRPYGVPVTDEVIEFGANRGGVVPLFYEFYVALDVTTAGKITLLVSMEIVTDPEINTSVKQGKLEMSFRFSDPLKRTSWLSQGFKPVSSPSPALQGALRRFSKRQSKPSDKLRSSHAAAGAGEARKHQPSTSQFGGWPDLSTFLPLPAGVVGITPNGDSSFNITIAEHDWAAAAVPNRRLSIYVGEVEFTPAPPPPTCDAGVCCDGSGGFKSNTPCRTAPEGSCLADAVCSGSSPDCPNTFKPANSPCPWKPTTRPYSADGPTDAQAEVMSVSSDEAAAWVTDEPQYEREWPECMGRCSQGVCVLRYDHPACCYIRPEGKDGYDDYGGSRRHDLHDGEDSYYGGHKHHNEHHRHAGGRPYGAQGPEDVASTSREGYWRSREWFCWK